MAFFTGNDSPVRAASSTLRLTASMTRASAGTRAPASRRTHVARHQLARRDVLLLAVAQHGRHGCGHSAQPLDGALGAVLLHEAEHHREEHDDRDGDGLQGVAQQRGEADGDQQDQDQDVLELREEEAPRGDLGRRLSSSFGPCSSRRRAASSLLRPLLGRAESVENGGDRERVPGGHWTGSGSAGACGLPTSGAAAMPYRPPRRSYLPPSTPSRAGHRRARSRALTCKLDAGEGSRQFILLARLDRHVSMYGGGMESPELPPPPGLLDRRARRRRHASEREAARLAADGHDPDPGARAGARPEALHALGPAPRPHRFGPLRLSLRRRDRRPRPGADGQDEGWLHRDERSG